MKLQNNNAVVLQLLRLGSAAIVVLLINLGFYLYGKETPVWILFGLGLLTIIVGLINIIFYRLSQKQSVTKSYLTLKQSFGIFLSVSLFVLCVEFFKLLTLTDFTDRIILFILMLLLILFDILTYLQVKKYFKR